MIGTGIQVLRTIVTLGILTTSSLVATSSLERKALEGRVLAEEGEVISSNAKLALAAYARAISFSTNDTITKKVLVEIESNGRWFVVNSDGCGGRFQFCRKTRKYVTAALGIPENQWMEKSNQLLMFDYLFEKNKDQIAGYDLPVNSWFLYGGWQQGPKGIEIIARVLRDRVRLRADVHAGIRNNLSKADKKKWENRTREIMYSIWRSSSYRKEGTRLFALSTKKMTYRQKRHIQKTLTKEGYKQYKLESDSILATIWANKFSSKIESFELKQ